MFHLINLETWERREHFEYYRKIVKSGYTLTANIDITDLLSTVQERGLRFYPVFIYVVASAINQLKECRMAYDSDGNLGYWDVCHPSYTIFHEDDCTFSDIWTEFTPDFSVFYSRAVEDMESYKDVKGIKAKPNKPANFTPMSCIPWLTYTSQSYDTPQGSPLLFPVIMWGKYFTQDKKTFLPFSAYVQHTVCDGYHTAKLINTVQSIANNCSEWM